MPEQVSQRVVGRDALLADLVAWLEPALLGRGRSVLLVGEPGIGKSTVVEMLVEWAVAAGFQVSRGWCAEAGMPPFWPWRSALQAAGIWPRFAVEDGGAAGADVRTAAFASVVEALETAGRERPLLVAMDDLHWADPATLQLLQTVAAAGPALPVALVLTSRNDILDVPDATRQALTDLPTGLRRVTVPPLEARWAAGLVRQVAGADLPEEAVSDVVVRTGGNPFFVAEVARLLAGGGAAGPLVVPAGVREAVQRRLVRLPQLNHATLIVAAVIGESATGERDAIETELVAAVSGTDLSTVVQRLDAAVRAGLISVDPADHSRLRFRHALVRATLVGGASIVELGRLHRRVAEMLTEQAGSRRATASRSGWPTTGRGRPVRTPPSRLGGGRSGRPKRRCARWPTNRRSAT